MIFVDTGALVAKYLKRDQYYADARPIWERIERERAVFCFDRHFDAPGFVRIPLVPLS